MRIRFVFGAELTSPRRDLAAFGIISRARIAACTGSEDGSFAGCESGWGYEEYKLVVHCSRRSARHSEGYGSIDD